MYEIPTPGQIRDFMAENNLTGIDMAAMTGVSPRAVRHWVSPAGKGNREIPWAAWALIQVLTGKKKKNEVLKMVDRWKEEKSGIRLFKRGNQGRPISPPAK